MFVFVFIILRGGSKKILLRGVPTPLLPMFSCKNFIAFSLTFRPVIHFEFIVVCRVIECSAFLLLRLTVQFSLHRFSERLSLLHCVFLPFLSEVRRPRCRVFLWTPVLFR